jgi:hypothetical protein
MRTRGTKMGRVAASVTSSGAEFSASQFEDMRADKAPSVPLADHALII